MSTSYLTGVILKRDRAEQHLNVLTEALDIFERSDPYGVVREGNSEQTEYIWKARVSTQPSLEWGPVIGDFLFNLRSCLDNLAWALAKTVGTPPGDTQYPIFFTRESWEHIRGDGLMQGPYQMRGLPKDAQAIIEFLQPYHRQIWPAGPPFGASVETADFNPLWHLHSLNNVDKHRLVHVAITAVESIPIFFSSPDMAAGVRQEAAFGATEDGTVIMRVISEHPLEESHMYSEPTLAIGIPETDKSRGLIIPADLSAMLARVDIVIKLLT